MNIALILAGGSGQRMGNIDMPKQFLILDNKAILLHTLEKFFVFRHEIDKVIVATHPTWFAYTRDLISRNFKKQSSYFEVITGGTTRHSTVRIGLKHIQQSYDPQDDDVVLTHDAVRPFVSYRIIKENIKGTQKWGAVDTVIPAVDTIVYSKDGLKIAEIPKREEYYQGQTPQSFFINELVSVYSQFTDEQLESTTDVAKLYRLLNKSVYLVMGEQNNFKITTPFDLSMARALIERADTIDQSSN
ncbi:IspD/TarI family cytidylyltransferase [Calidifontibacillus oryziterrae]|uniref:IspD/TarI family cytidylyltransferase n=1 Tax=Calidifontibacillus oryziterrae TaxID=1191699 RepID=UPI00031E10F8|nr:2-C-methyl-D-erythritol 4-phosphate cytidylyltransferase [Calidifontibacillus oryziterrae]